MTRLRIAVVVSLLAATLAVGSAEPVAAASCGVWRWPVKSLLDKARTNVHFPPIAATVKRFRTKTRPGMTFGTNTPRSTFTEFHTWKLKARPRQAIVEDDSDIHLVISVPSAPHKTMIVEFPNPACVRSAFKRRQMKAARASFVNKCGAPSSSSWHYLKGLVTITGVGFWDEIHGQTGSLPTVWNSIRS